VPQGGETEALKRLKHYLWDTDLIAKYFEIRNGMLGADYSTKFAPWMAAGCLSPRTIFHEVKKYEEQRTANKSTYWVIFELIWRDFFRCGSQHVHSPISTVPACLLPGSRGA
jgi:deoxyribodipyrimidine photo-lyase